jgi:hypothetical protein
VLSEALELAEPVVSSGLLDEGAHGWVAGRATGGDHARHTRKLLAAFGAEKAKGRRSVRSSQP